MIFLSDNKWTFPESSILNHNCTFTYSDGAWLILLMMRLLFVDGSLPAVLCSDSWCRRRLWSSNVSLRLRKSTRTGNSSMKFSHIQTGSLSMFDKPFLHKMRFQKSGFGHLWKWVVFTEQITKIWWSAAITSNTVIAKVISIPFPKCIGYTCQLPVIVWMFH